MQQSLLIYGTLQRNISKQKGNIVCCLMMESITESIFPIGRQGKTMLSKIITITYKSGVTRILVQNDNISKEN